MKRHFSQLLIYPFWLMAMVLFLFGGRLWAPRAQFGIIFTIFATALWPFILAPAAVGPPAILEQPFIIPIETGIVIFSLVTFSLIAASLNFFNLLVTDHARNLAMLFALIQGHLLNASLLLNAYFPVGPSQSEFLIIACLIAIAIIYYGLTRIVPQQALPPYGPLDYSIADSMHRQPALKKGFQSIMWAPVITTFGFSVNLATHAWHDLDLLRVTPLLFQVLVLLAVIAFTRSFQFLRVTQNETINTYNQPRSS